MSLWLGAISLFPEMFASQHHGGVFDRAIKAGLIELKVFNPRDYATDRHRTVDDKPYGGGAGMVMMADPLAAALAAARVAAPEDAKVVLLSPQGQVFNQALAVRTSTARALILVCGRYEGVDQRFVEACVDEEWSIGDYVLSGGELPAMVVMDAVARHIPGALGNHLSLFDESHLDGKLEYPQYTRPEATLDRTVPPVLLSGDHARINEHRRREALLKTFERRPELLTRRVLSAEERTMLLQAIPPGT